MASGIILSADVRDKVRELFSDTEGLDEEDLMRCAGYLVMREPDVDGNSMTVREIAEHYGVTQQTIYNWLRGWKEAGILRRVREVLIDLYAEENVLADLYVLQMSPMMKRRMVSIVLHAKSDKNAIDAWKALNEHVINPLMDRKVDDGGERDYLGNLGDRFDPLYVPPPKED